MYCLVHVLRVCAETLEILECIGQKNQTVDYSTKLVHTDMHDY
jgi:hypothetical protein